MSKKLSKVLVVAVVLVLSMSLFALVACGGPEPLDSKGAQAELQKNFNSASKKTVTENVNIKGIDINAAGVVEIQVKNVDVKLVRTYESGKMNLKATVSNIQIAMPKGLPLVKQFAGSVVGNFDAKVIETLKEVVMTADITLNVDGADDYLVVNSFKVSNLDKVVDEKNVRWSVLEDFGAEKTISEGESINPRKGEGTKAPVGIFSQMDYYATASVTKDGEEIKAGTLLEQFIAENYQMISAYNFPSMEVNDKAIKYNGKADLNKVYAVGNDILKCYKNNAIVVKEVEKIKVGALVDKLFGKDSTVKGVVSSLTDLEKTDGSKVNMTGELVAVDGKWQVSKLNTTQTVNVEVTKKLLDKVIDELLPVFDIDLSKIVINGNETDLSGTIKSAIAEGLKTGVTATVNATFTYGE